MGLDRRILKVQAVLAVNQLVGWGTLSLPAVIGRDIAEALDMDIAAVFAGTSVQYLFMGLCGPLLAGAYARFGARLVLAGGCALAAPGFVALACAQGAVSYYLAWALLGAAGSAMLTTAAHIMLSEVAGPQARRAIGALMLVTGLSSSIFWPVTVWLAHLTNWRATCVVYAVLIALVSPLCAYGLPRHPREPRPSPGRPAAASPQAVPPVGRRIFLMIVAGIGLNAFVAFGIGSVLVELLRAEGLPPDEALALGSSLGVIQISARALDMLGGGRWDGVTTGMAAGAAMIVGFLLLLAGGGAYWTVVAFVLLYGLGSGALSVVRSTLPLVFYDKAAYARATSHIALPLNLLAAASPPLLAGLTERVGAPAAAGLALLCTCGMLAILVALGRRRPVAAVVQAA